MRRLAADATAWWASAPDDRRWRRDAGEALLRARLLQPAAVDGVLTKALASGRPGGAMEFAVHAVRQSVVADGVLCAADLPGTLDVLARVAERAPAGAAPLTALVAQARRGPARGLPPPGDREARERGEGEPPPGLKEAAARALDGWAAALEDAPCDRVQEAALARVRAGGALEGGPRGVALFFRALVDLAVAHCLNLAADPAGGGGGARPASPLNHGAVDLVVRLAAALVRARGGGPPLLRSALDGATAALLADAAARGGDFCGRPYFRFFVGLIQELGPDADVAAAAAAAAAPAGALPPPPPQPAALLEIAAALDRVQPLRAPGFAFPWLELVSHRAFAPRLLAPGGGPAWAASASLLASLLRFQEPYLRTAEMGDAVRLLYKGSLRVLLGLLHDFPEFLAEAAPALCAAVPPPCVQMRNLVLSAFPRSMRLPDPFTPALKVDLLPETAVPPRLRPPPASLLPRALRVDVDAWLSGGGGGDDFVASLPARLRLPPAATAAAGSRYDAGLVGALVLHLGCVAAGGGNGDGTPAPPGPPSASSPSTALLARLATSLDPEGRHALLNACANQLRYPNSHTHYFSCVLLSLFGDGGGRAGDRGAGLQEAITRVLLERLIVNRPHPWGLLITFIELIKNPRHAFWGHPFTRCAPEVERLFESVARSCMGPPAGGGGGHEGGEGVGA